jgi:glycosyltransferase involved in cell wall biosynthesis
MIRVVEVISDTNIGGAGILLINRLSCYDRSVFTEYVILPKGSMLKKRLLQIGVKVFEINGCFDRSFDTGAIIEITSILKKLKPHILNAHGCLSARISALLSKVPIKIYTRHCVYPPSKLYRSLAVRIFMGFTNRLLSDKIIAVAESAKQNLIDMGILGSQIEVIINGASPLTPLTNDQKQKIKERLGISDAFAVVSICARLEKCKDHVTFLRAAAILSKLDAKYSFLVIGDGSLRPYLKNCAKKLGIEDKVIFTGFVEDTSPYMNVTDINVNCSIGTETSSLAISEGMSLGIPCVASDYGGNPYMVENGVNGYIFERRNSLELAQKILLLRNGTIYSSFSKNAFLRFEQELNTNVMTKKTENLYLSLIKNIRK